MTAFNLSVQSSSSFVTHMSRFSRVALKVVSTLDLLSCVLYIELVNCSKGTKSPSKGTKDKQSGI